MPGNVQTDLQEHSGSPRGEPFSAHRGGPAAKKKSELERAAEYCRKQARGTWNPERQDRSEYWIRLKARVAHALLKPCR
jgi:hypothetical protein